MTSQSRPSRWRRSVPTVLPALVAVAVCGALLFLIARPDDEPTATPVTTVTSTSSTIAEPTTTEAPAVPAEPVERDVLLARTVPEDPPETYRIVYDIVENGLARSETWTMRRPYESLVVSERDGEQVSGTATSVDALWTFLADRDGWLSVQPERHRAAFDLRPAPAIGPMIALDLVEETEPAEYAGTSCRGFRTGQPVSAGEATAPSPAETTELCVDDRGLLLHERWMLDGEVVVERTARSVEVGIEVDGAIFDPTPVVEDAEDFAAAFTTVALEADAETIARLRTEVPVPEGYTADGTVLRAGTPGASGPGVSEIVRFYSQGPELLEVAEFHVDGPAELGGGAAVPVEVDGWTEVWFVPDFRSSALQARLSDTAYVEVRGADPGFLFTVLDSLVRSAD